MYDKTTTIDAFLGATAAKQPIPGGGSIGALTGALAAAIGEMTLNYSVGRKANIPETDGILRQSLVELTRARGVMLQLMVEDQAAYDAFSAAQKIPAGAPNRQSQLDVTLLAAIRVPQAMAATAVAILEVADRVWEICNPHLLSDLAVCGELAMATVRSGVYNVRANLPSVVDPRERQHIAEASEALIAHATAIIKRSGVRIWERHAMEITSG